ncbi:MAG: hypothetical protein LC791_03765 [Acidobacteria bacterium]|nr:hypothetical protein [Acidobacteriota bacterium]
MREPVDARRRILRGWHGRSALIAAVLLLTLTVAGALAYQAQWAARSHRTTAENVLRDYAAFASSVLAQRARGGLNDVLAPQLTRLATSCHGRDRPPTIREWLLAKDT